jgi:hypothetical protein
MVMMEVMAVGARAASSGDFRARLRDARGQWAVLQVSPLIGGMAARSRSPLSQQPVIS